MSSLELLRQPTGVSPAAALQDYRKKMLRERVLKKDAERKGF